MAFRCLKKEIDRETVPKVMEYEENLKKWNRKENHYLHGDEISYIY
jgi:16S rRNA G527 N7-methylase RsmG